MKRNVCRIGSAAVCAALCLALGCSCSVLPPASGKPAAPASSVPTDAHGDPLYDSSRLDDGKLRILYGYDNSGGACTVLCGSKVLYQACRSENVNLLQDTVTGETNYWFRTWADPDAYCGRRSGLFDKDGNEVMTFEGEQNASMQNGLLVLQEAHAVNGSYENGYDDYGTCQVNVCPCRMAHTAASCAGTGWCSPAMPAQQTLPRTHGTMNPPCTAGSLYRRRTVHRLTAQMPLLP